MITLLSGGLRPQPFALAASIADGKTLDTLDSIGPNVGLGLRF